MSRSPHTSSVLFRQNVGFSALLLMAWLVEFLNLAHVLYGATAGFDWGRVLLRTLVIVAIWVFVHFTTRPLLKRLHYLEDFLRVCSWCRKVGHDGEWLTMEQYFGAKFKTETSHGICPDCARAQMDKFSSVRAVKK